MDWINRDTELVVEAETFDPAADPERAVVLYRRVIALRDAAITDDDRAEFNAIAQRLRDSWREWQGEDSLNEMAFGEPEG